MRDADGAMLFGPTPGEELRARRLRIQSLLQQASLDGLLVLQPVDMFYWAGTVQIGALFIPSAGEAELFVQKNIDRARKESALGAIRHIRSLSEMAEHLPASRASRIAVEMEVLPAAELSRLKKYFPSWEFLDGEKLIRQARQIKSPFEIDLMREAGRRHAEVFARIPEWIADSTTELELSARIESGMRLRGHQGLIRLRRWNLELYYGPVASGPTAAYPSYFDGPVGTVGLSPAVPQGASLRKIAPGEPLLIDLVFGYGGYHVDKSRTFALGGLAREFQEAFEYCLELDRAIVSRLRPGRKCSEIYLEVMGLVENGPYREFFMGYGSNKVGFLGHGVGLELDEWPVLAGRFERVLEPGMTLAVEPKIFFPERGGVGIENTYLVTEDGAERLTDFPDDLVIV
jgi:Xaa-Pro dipeptidase